jgi:hypothetical protein
MVNPNFLFKFLAYVYELGKVFLLQKKKKHYPGILSMKLQRSIHAHDTIEGYVWFMRENHIVGIQNFLCSFS